MAEEVKKKINRKLKIELKGITFNHDKYIETIRNNRVTLCSGKAGTGKTFIAMGIAAELLMKGEVKKIIISRPIVNCGVKNFGALPGDIDDKTAPYMFPVYDALEQFLDESQVESLIESGRIQVCPLEYMRGSSFRNSFIVLDEAQNADKKQLKMFLTRFTSTCKVVLTGDSEQSDLVAKFGDFNPFALAMARLDKNIENIGIVRLTKDDIVRDELIKKIDEALGEDFN